MFLIIQFFRLHVVDSSKLTKRRNILCTTQERDHILLRMSMLIRVIMHANPSCCQHRLKLSHLADISTPQSFSAKLMCAGGSFLFHGRWNSHHVQCRLWQTLSPPWRPTNLYYWIADCSSSSPVFNTWATETWNLISRSLPYIVLLSLLLSMATFPA